MKKYGFIYIWYDRKRKMYYIGSHWGTEDDGYICSSNRMRDAYRRRPNDFRRKIISKNICRKFLLDEEFKWLSMICEEELGKKYYNLRKHKWGHWSTDEKTNLSTRQKIIETLKRSDIRQKLSEINKGKTVSEETKIKIRAARSKQIYTKETCHKISESHKGIKNHFYGKEHSEETKKKMSESAKRRKPMSEETKLKISESAKRRAATEAGKLQWKNAASKRWIKEERLQY